MAHDIFLIELDDAYPFDVPEPLHRIAQTGLLGRRQVDLGHVTRHNHLPPYTESGKEHFQLESGRVLRLIEDDHRIGECASAHESKRGYLDGPFLHIFRQFGSRDHVLQRIVKRLQVRVDLLFHIARQETEFLPCFHSRPGEDDSSHFTVLECPHGQCDSRIGLTATRRSDSEEQVVLFVCLHECPLVG